MNGAFTPIEARTHTAHRRVEASAYDCVRLMAIRNGSMILYGRARARPVVLGEVVMIAPNVRVGYEPESRVTATTILIDADYLIEHLFWQHLGLIPDRDAARELAARLYPDPVQVLRLGEPELELLGPTLDELVTVTETARSVSGYYRTHALLFTVLDAITRHVQ